MNDGEIIELKEGVLSDQILILQTPPTGWFNLRSAKSR